MLALNKPEALEILKNYSITHVLVFTPDDLEKSKGIVQIAGIQNPSEYLKVIGSSYRPTELGGQVTLLGLILDDQLHPMFFTKMFDNGKGKIFRINY